MQQNLRRFSAGAFRGLEIAKVLSWRPLGNQQRLDFRAWNCQPANRLSPCVCEVGARSQHLSPSWCLLQPELSLSPGQDETTGVSVSFPFAAALVPTLAEVDLHLCSALSLWETSPDGLEPQTCTGAEGLPPSPAWQPRLAAPSGGGLEGQQGCSPNSLTSVQIQTV